MATRDVLPPPPADRALPPPRLTPIFSWHAVTARYKPGYVIGAAKLEVEEAEEDECGVSWEAPTHTHLLLSLTPPARSSCHLAGRLLFAPALDCGAALGGTKRGVTPALTTGAEGKFNGQMKNRMKSEGREDGLLSKTDKCKRAVGHMTSGRSLRSGDCLEIHPAAPRNDIYV